MSTASNIKSKQVRKDVKSALKSSLHLLKTYRSAKTHTNGLVLCAGSIDKRTIENKPWV